MDDTGEVEEDGRGSSKGTGNRYKEQDEYRDETATSFRGRSGRHGQNENGSCDVPCATGATASGRIRVGRRVIT